jgi:hypothetical protein
VEKQPEGTRFRWVLGKAEHCPDCIVLASQSPFTKQSLPTVPKAGATQCRSNCKCKLVVARGRMSARERADAKDAKDRKGESLADMMSFPAKLPKGMRLATGLERVNIDDLWSKINYQRRRIANLPDGKARRAAMGARKAANQELIEFLEANNIYETPLWSVDEVIDARHIGARAQADIYRHSLDGESLDLLTDRQLDNLIRGYEDEIPTIRKATKTAGFKIPPEADTELPDADTPFFERGAEEYALVAPGLVPTKKLLARLLEAARGHQVQVAPFSDDIVSRTHVWIRGPREEVGKVLDKLKGGRWVAVPVRTVRRRG